MKIEKILFILSIMGILLLLFFSQLIKESYTGKIESIRYSPNKIIISLENQEENLVIFENKIFNLKKGNKILYQGKKDIYKEKEQIIIDKIICLDC
tara:strand:+ start:1937 stop:2224 length:288 start_codon:yes stop_codon:yes gene_type:complete